jgi:hypothetical protein
MADVPVYENDRVFVNAVNVNGQIVYAYDFLIYDPAGLKAVYQSGFNGLRVDLEYPAHFTVNGVGNPNGGTITLTLPIAAVIGDTVTCYGDTPIKRETDFQQSGDYFAATVNSEEDNQFLIMQELRRDAERAVKAPLGSPGYEIQPGAAGQVPGYDNDPTILKPVTLAGNIVPVTNYMRDRLADIDTAEEFAANLFPALDGRYQRFVSRAQLAAATVDAGVSTVYVGAEKYTRMGGFPGTVLIEHVISNGGTVAWLHQENIIDPVHFGADPDVLSAGNDTIIDNCIDYGRRMAKSLNGKYRKFMRLSKLPSAILPGLRHWRAIEFDFSQAVIAWGDYLTSFRGTAPTNSTLLTSSVAAGALSIGLASIVAFAPEQRVLVSSTADWGTNGPKKSELHKIFQTGGGAVSLISALKANYATGDTARMRIVPFDVILDFDDVTITGPGKVITSNGGLAEWCDIRKLNVTINGCGDAGFDVLACLGDGHHKIKGRCGFRLPRAISAFDHTTNRMTVPFHGLRPGVSHFIYVNPDVGAVYPAGLALSVAYSVTVVDANTIQFAVDFTSNGTGTFIMHYGERGYMLNYGGSWGGQWDVDGHETRHIVATGASGSGQGYTVARNVIFNITGTDCYASPGDSHPGITDVIFNVNVSMSPRGDGEEAHTIQAANVSLGSWIVKGGSDCGILVQSCGTGDEAPNVISIGSANSQSFAAPGFPMIYVQHAIAPDNQPIFVNVAHLGGKGPMAMLLDNNVANKGAIYCSVGALHGQINGSQEAIVLAGTSAGRIIDLTINSISLECSGPTLFGVYAQGPDHRVRINSGRINVPTGGSVIRCLAGANVSLGAKVLTLVNGAPATGSGFKYSALGTVSRDTDAVAVA